MMKCSQTSVGWRERLTRAGEKVLKRFSLNIFLSKGWLSQLGGDSCPGLALGGGVSVREKMKLSFVF